MGAAVFIFWSLASGLTDASAAQLTAVAAVASSGSQGGVVTLGTTPLSVQCTLYIHFTILVWNELEGHGLRGRDSVIYITSTNAFLTTWHLIFFLFQKLTYLL